MSEDGYVLTKASSCVGARWAETYEGMKYSLKIKKRDEESDFALYKIVSEEKNFHLLIGNSKVTQRKEIGLYPPTHPSKRSELVLKVEIIVKSVREGGVMGVMLTNDKSDLQGVKVSEVIPYAAAFRAGLKVGDIITHADKEE